jgi:hypothetical protein
MNMERYLDDIIKNYEDRIEKIQIAFQSSEKITASAYTLFDHVQNSLSELKNQRDTLNCRLSETLAKNASLRKRDYYSMMSGILNKLEEKGKNTEKKFIMFLEAQKEVAQLLKNSLLGLKDIDAQDAKKKIPVIKKHLSQISNLQEKKKESVIRSFTEFKNLHGNITKCLESLLKKGDNLKIKDIKKVKNQLIKEVDK